MYTMAQLPVVDEQCLQISSPLSNIVIVQYLHLSHLFLCMGELYTG